MQDNSETVTQREVREGAEAMYREYLDRLAAALPKREPPPVRREG